MSEHVGFPLRLQSHAAANLRVSSAFQNKQQYVYVVFQQNYKSLTCCQNSAKQKKFSKLISKPLLENRGNIHLFKKKFYKSLVK